MVSWCTTFSSMLRKWKICSGDSPFKGDYSLIKLNFAPFRSDPVRLSWNFPPFWSGPVKSKFHPHPIWSGTIFLMQTWFWIGYSRRSTIIKNAVRFVLPTQKWLQTEFPWLVLVIVNCTKSRDECWENKHFLNRKINIKEAL